MSRQQIVATLVRHGETTLNVQRLIQGHTDVPLSEPGIKQAELLGKHICEYKFQRAYSSDLCRAKQTAEIILKYSKNPVDIIIDTRLRERCFGEAEGKYYPDVFEEAKQKGCKFDEYTPKGGETYDELTERARKIVKDLLCASAENATETENVLVVSHGGFILALFKYLFQTNNEYILKNFEQNQALRIPLNTGVSQFSISPSAVPGEKGKFIIEFFQINGTDHLKK